MATHPSPVLAPLLVSVSEHFSLPQTGDLVSTDQPFGLSMAESEFEGIPFDGILGLNYPNISIFGAISIFANLKNPGAISETVFAFSLSK